MSDGSSSSWTNVVLVVVVVVLVVVVVVDLVVVAIVDLVVVIWEGMLVRLTLLVTRIGDICSKFVVSSP
jgi:hypothetical protein